MGKNKEGKPAFVNICIWENDEPDRYGNHFSITENLNEDERKAGAKSVYIGNLKRADVKDNRTAEEIKKANDTALNDDLPW